VVTRTHKLILSEVTGNTCLFDLENDPEERVNLFQKMAPEEILATLAAMFAKAKEHAERMSDEVGMAIIIANETSLGIGKAVVV
jgi:hypothetical protein